MPSFTSPVVSNASQANIDIREKVVQHNAEAEQTGAPKLVIVEVAHSRGSLATSNALQVQLLDGKTNVPLGSVTLHGAAANAQRTADRVHEATSGQGQVYQSTHKDDLVGRVIGGNAPTGGVDAPFAPAHGVYGEGFDSNTKEIFLGNSSGSVAVPIPSTSKNGVQP